jgi:YesN/AraC family two-component response regulator
MNTLTEIAYKVIRGAVVIIADKALSDLYRGFPLHGERVEICPLKDALALSKNHDVDIMLLDCGTKATKGLDLLKQLKHAMPGIPIIFLTDNKSYETAVKAFRAGARDFVGKPVSLFELRIMIQQLLQVKRVSSEKRIPVDISENHNNGDFIESATTAAPPFVLRAIRYIEGNLADKLSLDKLAQEANLSKYHFSRLFFQHTGMTPLQFTTSMRIQRAKEILRSSECSVSDICSETGFNDLGTFIRQFKKHVGITPRTYRKSFKGL